MGRASCPLKVSEPPIRAMKDDSQFDSMLVQYYERYLIDQDADAFLRRTSSRYIVGTLERLAASGQRMSRRAAVFALGRLADYGSNATLGRALLDSDRGVRTLAESAIVRVWVRIGTASQQRRISAIAGYSEDGDHGRASSLASKLIQEAPWIAQTWYLRGRAFLHLGQCEAAVRDCHQALEINAYHFQAASIMGQSYQMKNDLVSALEAYRRALRLNPNLEEVRARVIQLQRTLKEK